MAYFVVRASRLPVQPGRRHPKQSARPRIAVGDLERLFELSRLLPNQITYC
jgi:hypothetical protein